MWKKFDVDLGRERLAPALSILGAARFRNVTAANLAVVVGVLRRRLGEAYGDRDLLSAATKFLWLHNRDSTIIFDSRARAALGTPPGDFDAFLKSWRRECRRNEAAIRDACHAVPGPLRLTNGDTVPRDQVRDASSRRCSTSIFGSVAERSFEEEKLAREGRQRSPQRKAICGE
jgi:hypothetical protein